MGRSSQTSGDFSGGLDLVSSLSDIAPNATPASMNFRANLTGGIDKVLGYTAFSDLGVGVSAHTLFYYENRAQTTKKLVAASSTKWQAIASDGSTVDLVTGLSATTDTTFVGYNDTLYGLSRTNNMRSTTTLGAASTTSYAPGIDTGPPQGLILGIWNDQMWVASGSGTTIVSSDVASNHGGTFTGAGSWPAANTVQLGGAQSEIIVGGQPVANGLLVFTNAAVYLIYDAATLSFRVVDPDHGCTSRKSIAVVNGEVFAMSKDGVFATDGNGRRSASLMIMPLFRNENPTLSNAAGTVWWNNYMCSYQRPNQAYNNFTLEFYPFLAKWIKHIGWGPPPCMPFQYPAYCWAHGNLASTGDTWYFIDASNQRYVRQGFNGGSFLTSATPGVATDIACFYETGPMSFGEEEFVKRLNRVRIVGRGDVYVAARVDYAGYDYISERFQFPKVVGALWDTAVWNTDNWSGYTLFDGGVQIPARGRRIQLRFYESGNTTAPLRDDIDISPSGQLGGAGVYEYETQFTESSLKRTPRNF